MPYEYSNPYQGYHSHGATSAPHSYRDSGSATTPVQTAKEQFKLLFTGLPAGVSDQDLYGVLTGAPLNLPADTTRVFNMHQPDKHFLGIAVVSVGTLAEAERVRVQYTGQKIDHNFQLSVHHILPLEQEYPFNIVDNIQKSFNPLAVTPPVQSHAPAPVATGPKTNVAPRPFTRVPAQEHAPAAKGKNGRKTLNGHAPAGPAARKPEGLSLLSRISQPGKGAKADQSKQAQLLEKQRANMSKSRTGAGGRSLAARLNPIPGDNAAGSSTKKPKTKANKAVAAAKSSGTGVSKVSRAKGRTGDAMDVDGATAEDTVDGAKGKGKGAAKFEKKSQEQLDEEMRLWQRQAKFA